MTIQVEIPMTLPSAANLREHWAAKAKRAKAQRAAVMLALKSFRHHTARGVREMILLLGEECRPEFMPSDRRILVTFTRIAPRKLDSDNNVSAFKACRDAVAEYFGLDDADPRFEWVYQQERGPAAVRIEMKVARGES